MLSLPQIKAQYPAALQPFSRFILREYLQHKLLQLSYDSPLGDRFFFLGGTCLRIVHGNSRFSEDLDFGNTGVTAAAFGELAAVVVRGMELEGYEVNMRMVRKDAYHCHVRFPELLFQEGLSDHREERILIQFDTEPQHFAFEPNLYLLNRFDIFTQIQTTPQTCSWPRSSTPSSTASVTRAATFMMLCSCSVTRSRPATPTSPKSAASKPRPTSKRSCWLTARPSTCRPWPTMYAPSCSIPGKTVWSPYLPNTSSRSCKAYYYAK